MIDHVEFIIDLIRHGQSTTNANPDLMGQLSTTPLSEHGVLQAKKLHSRLLKSPVYSKVYSSTYTRALDTAKIATEGIFSSQDIILAKELREYNAGDWTGVSRKEALTLPILKRMDALNSCFLPPNGESLHQVQRRASAWLEDNILYNDEIRKLYEEMSKAGLGVPRFAIFSHGMTIKTLLQYVMGFDRNFAWKVEIENTSISTVSFGKEGWRLHGINDYSHLR